MKRENCKIRDKEHGMQDGSTQTQSMSIISDCKTYNVDASSKI